MRLRLIVIAGVILALAACGVDEDARAKAAWIAGADVVCARVNGEIDALGEPETLADIADYAAKVKVISEGQLTELANLDPPKGDRETIQAMLGFIADGIEKTGQVESAARKGDAERTFEIVDEIEILTASANAMARDYGLRDCAGAT